MPAEAGAALIEKSGRFEDTSTRSTDDTLGANLELPG
jgi:hypothetical protein